MNPTIRLGVSLEDAMAVDATLREGCTVGGAPWFWAARRHHNALSPVVRDALDALAASAAPPAGMLLMRRPLFWDIPPTPTHQPCDLARLALPLWWLSVCGTRLGCFIGYPHDHAGALFQHVYPQAGHAHSLTSASSAVTLGFHTDHGFEVCAPAFVALLCLRSDPDRQAVTRIASAQMIADALPQYERGWLWEPCYEGGRDVYDDPSVPAQIGGGPLVPILSGHPANPTVLLDLALMRGTTPDAQDRLDRIKIYLEEHAWQVTLAPGDMLLMDNRRVVHDRSPFVARYDGTDRWLVRAYLAK